MTVKLGAMDTAIFKQLNVIFAYYWPTILDDINKQILSSTERAQQKDRVNLFKLSQQRMRTEASSPILTVMYKSMADYTRYLHQHYNLLRHSSPDRNDLSLKQMSSAVEKLANLVFVYRAFAQMSIYFTTENCVLQLYSIYHTLCTDYGVSRPAAASFYSLPTDDIMSAFNINASSSSSPNINNMPNGKSIAWYKEHKFHSFLKNAIITFQGGKYAHQPCRIVRFNGKNTICIFENGEKKYMNNSLPLTFVLT